MTVVYKSRKRRLQEKQHRSRPYYEALFAFIAALLILILRQLPGKPLDVSWVTGTTAATDRAAHGGER